MRKYVANRKDVCAGKLVKPIDVGEVKSFDINGRVLSAEEMEELGILVPSFSAIANYRGMLFNVNDDGLANDLIYTTPTNYPIKKVEFEAPTKSELMISSYVELEELLKYLGYGVDLTQKDLNRIYERLITNNHWLKHHMELFGWRKKSMNYYDVYITGGTETIPMSIYRNLSDISGLKNGKPNKKEPGYSLIKKRR